MATIKPTSCLHDHHKVSRLSRCWLTTGTLTLVVADGDNQNGSWPLGDTLRATRRELGLSQRTAAQRADVSRTLWQQLESGMRQDGYPVQPKIRTLVDVAHALGRDPTELLELAGIEPDAHEPARKPGRRSVSETEMAQVFAGLNARQQAALVELMEAMLEPSRESQFAAAVDDEQPQDTEPDGDEAVTERDVPYVPPYDPNPTAFLKRHAQQHNDG